MSNRQLVYIKDQEIISMVAETLEKQLKPLSVEIIERLTENNKLLLEGNNKPLVEEIKKILVEEMNKQREFYSKKLKEYYESTEKNIDRMYDKLEKVILESSKETNNKLDEMLLTMEEIFKMNEINNKSYIDLSYLANKAKNILKLNKTS